MKCSDCKKTTHSCPRCGNNTEILKVRDGGFHQGVCLVCDTVLLEPCPEVHRDPTRWEMVMWAGREVIRRLPSSNLVVGLLTALFIAFQVLTVLSCEGTLVSGPFWLECVK